MSRMAPAADGRTALAGLALLAIPLLLLAAGGAGPAAGAAPEGPFVHDPNETTDLEPPEMVSGSRRGPLRMEIRFTDFHDVDEETIQLDDFRLSAPNFEFNNSANPEAYTVVENGSDTTVVLRLQKRVPIDDITVSIADGQSICDTLAENTEDPDHCLVGEGQVKVTGMDGVDPQITRFSATDAEGGPSRITVDATEKLSSISLIVNRGTRVIDRIPLSEFEIVGTGTTYTTTYTPDRDGENYYYTLENITDRNGNTESILSTATFRADITGPEVGAGIDFTASTGLNITLQASRARDLTGVESYSWDFGDGETATGKRVTHFFRPGNYTVVLEATDPFGNVGRDTLTLNLTEESDAGLSGSAGTGVSVSKRDETAIASVFRARAGRAVDVAADGSLASHGVLSLEELRVEMRRNASFDLAVGADGPEAAADLPNARVLGTMTVLHDVPDAAIEEVTFDFGVSSISLDAITDSPERVTLYRRSGGQWQELDTRLTGNDGENYRYAAESPGFSRFAVALPQQESDTPTATPTETPDTPTETPTETPDTPTGTPTVTPTESTPVPSGPVVVASASLNRTQVPPNGTVMVNATLENTGDSLESFTAGLTVNDTLVETLPVRSVPANGNRTIQFFHTVGPNASGEMPVAVNGTAAGTITVGGGGGILGIFGFLPLGLIQLLVTYVGGVVTAGYLGLKAAALYLDV